MEIDPQISSTDQAWKIRLTELIFPAWSVGEIWWKFPWKILVLPQSGRGSRQLLLSIPDRSDALSGFILQRFRRCPYLVNVNKHRLANTRTSTRKYLHVSVVSITVFSPSLLCSSTSEAAGSPNGCMLSPPSCALLITLSSLLSTCQQQILIIRNNIMLQSS